MNRPGPHFHQFVGKGELAAELARQVAGHLRQRLAIDPQASLVVSGGATPEPFFGQLSREDVAWNRVYVTLADERWVAPGHPDSNERLVRSQLLTNRAADAVFISLKNSAATARQGEEECHRRLAPLPRPFAAVILGMGGDGHTASFFAGANGLATALDPAASRNCLALTPPAAPHERITMTLPLLLDTDLLVLHITGEEKRAVLARALAEGPAAAMPVRAVLHQRRTPVHIYWSP